MAQPTPSARNSASAPDRPRGRGGSTLRWGVATIVAVVAVSAFTATFVAARYEAQLGVMARQLSAAHEEMRRHEAASRVAPRDEGALIDLLLDPSTRVITLRAPGPSPVTSGRMVWSDTKGGRLLVAGLPAPPGGRTYALWIVVKGRARLAGTFSAGVAHEPTQPFGPVPGAGAADAFLVTVESGGDHATPTGSMVLASP
jgi:anti-sigma-K factor RskA